MARLSLAKLERHLYGAADIEAGTGDGVREAGCHVVRPGLCGRCSREKGL